MQKCICIVFLLFATSSFAQLSPKVTMFSTLALNGSVEENTTNYVRAYPDGGWVVCSFIRSGDNHEIVLLRYDNCGAQVFAKKYNATQEFFRIGDMIVDSDGAILITGYHGPWISTADVFLMKIDSVGDLIWTYVYSNGLPNYTYSVGERLNGDYFINGNTKYSSQSTSYNFILNLDKNGIVKNTKEYVPTVIWGRSIPTSDGGIIARTGSVIYKIDAANNLDWIHTYHYSSYTQKPVEVSDGYIFGRWRSIAAKRESHLYKLSKNGDLLWSTAVDTVESNLSISRHQGDLIVAVATKYHNGSYPISIRVFNTDGKKLSEHLFAPDPSIRDYQVTDHCVVADGSIVVSGYANKNGQVQLFSAKTTSSLKFLCGELTKPFIPGSIAMNKVSKNSDVRNAIFTRSSETIITTKIQVDEDYTCYELEDPPVFTPIDTLVCVGTKVLLESSYPNAEYLWHDGSTTENYIANGAGNYFVDISVCDVPTRKIFVVDQSECNCTIYVPNAFSPNGNDVNDLFIPKYECEFTEYNMRIYNRWGQLVFHTDDSNIAWDGSYNAGKASAGVYVYELIIKTSLGEQKKLRGGVTLLN